MVFIFYLWYQNHYLQMVQMFWVEESSIDHDIDVIFHFPQGMIIIIDIHLNSLASCLKKCQDIKDWLSLSSKITFREW